jgi:hypothetical protein
MKAPVKPGVKIKKIFYVGADTGYLETIKSRFIHNYPSEKFDFPIISPRDTRLYQRIFAHLVTNSPTIIYIDFSLNRDAQLKLAQLITRETSLKDIPVIGLVEEKEHVIDCLSSGVSITHVKCGEYHDVVYNPMLLAFPKSVVKPQFAKAKFSKQVELIDDFRVGYMTKDTIHAEGNILLKPGDVITVDLDMPASLLPSKDFIVKAVDDKNLYYDYQYSYELEYVFVDKPEIKESDQEDILGETDPKLREKKQLEIQKRLKQQESEYADTLSRTKRKIRDWIQDKSDGSVPKKTRIMIVDPGLSIMKLDKLMDEYPYAIRFQTQLSHNFQELMRLRPNIIAFQFIRDDLFDPYQDWLNPPKKNAKRDSSNETDPELTIEEIEIRDKVINDEAELARQELIRLISFIKQLGDYNPFLIIFNCNKYTSSAFQESFKYPLVLTHKSTVELGIITHMAQVLEKKQEDGYNLKLAQKISALKTKDPQKYRNLKPSDFEEVRFYIRKSSSLSHGSYRYPVTIETLTESELTFNTEAELDLTSFRLSFPLDLSIALVPNGDGKKYEVNGKLKVYKALIHSVDEIDKKGIRRYVNEIFFNPLNEKKAQEAKKFQEVQEKALKEREEANKKAQEAKRKAEKRNDELITPGAENQEVEDDPEPLS